AAVRPAADRGRRGTARRPAVRAERVRHRPRHRGRGGGHAARDHRQGARRGGRGLRGRGQAGRGVHRRQEGHVGRLLVRGPGAVQRRVPDPADRYPRAGGDPDPRVPQARRGSHPDRLPALPRGDRAVRPGRDPDRPRARGGGRPGPGRGARPGCGPDGARSRPRGHAMSVTSPAAQAEVLFSANEALAAARNYAGSIASGVIGRDRAGAVPYAELAALDASGLLGITVPGAYFGPDLSPVVLAEVIRTIAAVDPAIAQVPQAHFLFVDVLATHGTPAQQERLFTEVLDGARLGNGLAERGGQHAQDLRTRL